MYRSNPTRAALWSVAFGILLAGAATATAVRAGPAPAAADPLAGALEAVPARQGLAVCVGTTDGRLEAGLADAGMLVHAVSPDRAVVLAVRAKLAEAGKAGAATVDWVPSLKALPYNDHLANLLVADLDANPTLARDEALRVVRPLGVAYLRSGGAWQVVRKPMPPAMDDWSHFDHGPDGNPQSTDRLVGVPKGLQWHASGSGTPTSNTRLAGGRWFCGHKISGPAAKDAPQHFSARDAFNGMLLWRREEDRTVGDLRGVQERSLVASDKVVVGLIGEAGPARVLDAATGKEISVLADGLARPLTKKTYGKQPQTLQHVLTDGLLVQAYGPDVVGLDAATGKPRWRWACPEGQSVAFLVAGGGRAFVGLTRDREFAQFHYQNWYADLESLAAIDLATGKQAWSTDAVAGFKSFNLVYHDGAVYTIDSAFKVSVKHPDRLDVAVPYGALVRVNAADGKLAFRKDLAGVAAKDVAWHNKLRVQDGALVPTFANAVRTFSTADGTEGKTLFELGKGFQDPLPFCSTPRGTANGQLSGKFARFADFTTQTYTAITVGRTRCDEGSYPGYGMIFTGDDGCGCTSWLRGHLAMQCTQDTVALSRVADDQRLERGPAYGSVGDAAAAKADEWPALLGGTSRSSATAAAAPGELPVAFTAKVPLAKPTGPYAADWAEDNQRCGAVTPPVVAGGRVLVASTDAHTLHALDPATGKILWSYQTGGRIDSPPTVYRGLALFGSHDGHVYALRLADGQLAWRFLAAPGRRNIVVSGQVECLWPVRGSVTILDGKLYATAGRHNQTDGGVFLWRLDPVTGAAEASATIDDRDSSGSPPGPALKDYHGRIADVLSVNDAATWLYMGPVAIHPKSLAWCNLSVVPQVPAKNVAVPASFIPGGPDLNWKTEGVLNFLCAPTTGIVDRRSNVGGSKGQGGFRWNAVDGYRGGLRAERMAKVGRTIIGARGATLVAWDLDEKGKPKGGDRADPREVAKLPAQRPAALVAAGDRFVLATPASGGKTTAAVTVLNRDGTTAASAAVPAPVVTYGLAVAGGRVYAALEDGTLMCFGQ